MSNPSGDDKQFRRGVVLGLTMAEITLLLLFVLMLVLAGKLLAMQRTVADANRQRIAAEKELTEIRPIVDNLKTTDPKTFDIMQEWVRAKEDLKKAQESLADYAPITTLIENEKKLNPRTSAREVATSLAELAKAGKEVMEKAQAFSPKLTPQQALARFEEDGILGRALRDSGGDTRGLLASAATCKADLLTCKGQTANLSARLGGELPPCWVDADGKAQYIFDARLREDGVWLSDNKVKGREAQQAALPLSGFVFGRGLESGQFIRAGAPLLKLSNDLQCRFYVRVYDETDAGSKARYKTLLSGVEDIFYKSLRQ